MARGKGIYKSTPFFWRQLFWKVGLISLLLLLLSQVAVIWLMGGQETSDAFSSGRRLIVALDSSVIDGKIISSSPPQEEPIKEDVKEPIKEPVKEPVKEPSIAPQPDSPENAPETKDTPPIQNQVEDKKEPETEVAKTETVVAPLINETPAEEVALPAISPSTNPPAEFSNNLTEKTEFGSMPKIASDGTKPWKYYSKPIVIKDKNPMIAIVITGLGSNKNISEQALRLPEAINLSFSPYAKDLNSWMTSARFSGHEILIDLPMEASNYPVSDPGPLGLLVSKEQAGNEMKIKKLMSRDVGYVGFITPRDDVFLDNNELFKSLLQVLSGRGLMLVVGRQPAKNETKEMIEKGNTASVIIDTIIDEELTPTAIQAQLSLLEQTAKQRGYAVGTTKGYPITIKQLSDWAAKLEENGFNLVPISQIVSKRF